MSPAGGVLLTAASLLAGWIGLWPLRGRLGAVGYHLASYPIGLALWPLVVSVLSVLHIGFRPLLPFVGMVAALFTTSLFLVRGCDESGGRPVPYWSYAAWGACVVGLSAVVAFTGWTAAGFDSLFNYEAWGVWLYDEGTFTRSIIGSFGAFIPSIHAANRFFGSDWTSTPYPVMSLHVTLLFVTAVVQWARARVGAAISVAIALGALALMVTTQSYVHHTLYVHSHMTTAAYLLLAFFGLQRAYLGEDDAGNPPSDATAIAWLLVAGVASAASALTRPDGIAYIAVPAVVGTLLWLAGSRSIRSQAVLVCAAALPVAMVYISSFYTLGLWRAKKLSGTKAAAVLVALALCAVASMGVGLLPRLRTWLGQRGRAMALTVALEIVGITGLVLLNPSRFAESTRNMVTNLFRTGGYGYLWYFAFGAILVSLAWGGQWRSGRWPSYLVFAILQFFIVAAAVHGVGHPGRLNPADSFNRVSFHAVPLVFWYVAMVVAALVEAFREQVQQVD